MKDAMEEFQESFKIGRRYLMAPLPDDDCNSIARALMRVDASAEALAKIADGNDLAPPFLAIASAVASLGRREFSDFVSLVRSWDRDQKVRIVEAIHSATSTVDRLMCAQATDPTESHPEHINYKLLAEFNGNLADTLENGLKQLYAPMDGNEDDAFARAMEAVRDLIGKQEVAATFSSEYPLWFFSVLRGSLMTDGLVDDGESTAIQKRARQLDWDERREFSNALVSLYNYSVGQTVRLCVILNHLKAAQPDG